MTRSPAPRVRAVLVGLAFVFATAGRSVVDATFYHHDGNGLAARVHVEAVDGNSCHAESCILNALAAPLRTGSLGMDELQVHTLPVSGPFDQPDTPPRSSLHPYKSQPRAPPTRV